MRNYYQNLIAEIRARQGRLDVEPRHIEGFIRIAYPTLNSLSQGEFEHEVSVAIICADRAGREGAEELARSFGL